jgi:hypothetical protein
MTSDTKGVEWLIVALLAGGAYLIGGWIGLGIAMVLMAGVLALVIILD